MNERLIVKSFGPVKDLDIVFKKVTLFIGDQGSGKSCVAKLFSMFKWLEKALITRKYSLDYFEKYIDARFKKTLCAYHRIDNFFNDEETYLFYSGQLYDFEYEKKNFHVTDKKTTFEGLPKIMYVPAERIILSSAEKKLKTFEGLPENNMTFNQSFWESKDRFKDGYKLPFGNLEYKYDTLNDISFIYGPGYKVRLTEASSGIQSSLSICMVSDHLNNIVLSGKDRPLSVDELQKLQKDISKIMDDRNLSDTLKEILIKRLSAQTRYDSFVNIVEEPELSLFPESQLEVLKLLCKVNQSNPNNKLVITTHSPYSLAIMNTLIMAGNVHENEQSKLAASNIISNEYCIKPGTLAAYRLNPNSDSYCKSILDQGTLMISKNDLDSASDSIMRTFNSLYRLYVKTR
ncbi:MAG: ATP-binding protein [Bacteroidales bacterium]|nr:ATP-binding protein [Bacteroidales bacterium]